MTDSILVRLGAGGLAFAGVTGAARADVATPSFTGDPIIAIGIIVLLVVLVWFFIRGALKISSRDKSDGDEAGVGILEGIDEDDEKRKRR